MNRLFLVLFGFMLVLAGCTQTQTQQFTCNAPYIQVGSECCLDQNSNSICDKDETLQEPPKNSTDPTTPAQTAAPEITTEKPKTVAFGDWACDKNNCALAKENDFKITGKPSGTEEYRFTISLSNPTDTIIYNVTMYAKCTAIRGWSKVPSDRYYDDNLNGIYTRYELANPSQGSEIYSSLDKLNAISPGSTVDVVLLFKPNRAELDNPDLVISCEVKMTEGVNSAYNPLKVEFINRPEDIKQ